MSDKIDDGGPAYPLQDVVASGEGRIIDLGREKFLHQRGMSLRDWYIGKLLQGQAAFEGMEGCNVEQWITSAQWIADAVIAARKAKP